MFKKSKKFLTSDRTMLEKVKSRYNSIPVQVKASFWFLICAFMQRGISFITTPIFTRLINTTEYGQFNIFNSWLGILTVIVSLNLSAGVYARGVVKFNNDQKVFTSTMQGLSLTLTIVWTVIYFVAHTFWNNIFSLTTFQMLCMFVMILSVNIFGFWSMSQRVDFKYRSLVIVTLSMSVVKPILGIILVKSATDKVTSRIFGLAVVEAFVCIILFSLQAVHGKKFFSAFYWKYALKFNIPLIPHYLSTTVLNSADRIMIGKMVNESSAGIYGLAYSISQIMTLFNTTLLQTIEPWLYKRINDKKIKDISKVAYPAFIGIAAVNLLLIALAPEAVKIFAPPEYYDAIWVIPPVAMSVYFIFSYTFFAVFEFYYEKTKLIATATSAGAVLNIVLNYIFIKIFGYYAAGYTTLVCYMVYAAFHMCFMHKICREQLNNEQPYSLRIYAGITVAFLLFGFTFMASYNYIAIRYALLGIMLVVMVVFHKEIIDVIKNILNLKKN